MTVEQCLLLTLVGEVKTWDLLVPLIFLLLITTFLFLLFVILACETILYIMSFNVNHMTKDSFTDIINPIVKFSM